MGRQVGTLKKTQIGERSSSKWFVKSYAHESWKVVSLAYFT